MIVDDHDRAEVGAVLVVALVDVGILAGDHEGHAEALARLQVARVDKSAALGLLAQIEERRGRLGAAREMYEKAIELDSANADAALGAARLVLIEGVYQDALARFQTVLRSEVAPGAPMDPSGKPQVVVRAKLGAAEALLAMDKAGLEPLEVELGPASLGRVVIDSGLEEGEQVAVSGNFLIDSQMQLAGKPSLIDPNRHTPKKGTEQSDNTPLSFASINVQRIAGEMGKKLEQLYRAYFALQKTYASDKQPPAELAAQLHALAQQLAEAV